jgi:hypothetical protein
VSQWIGGVGAHLAGDSVVAAGGSAGGGPLGEWLPLGPSGPDGPLYFPQRPPAGTVARSGGGCGLAGSLQGAEFAACCGEIELACFQALQHVDDLFDLLGHDLAHVRLDELAFRRDHQRERQADEGHAR